MEQVKNSATDTPTRPLSDATGKPVQAHDVTADAVSTVAGVVIGAVIAAEANIPAAIGGDRQEIGKLVVAGLAALWGYFSSRKRPAVFLPSREGRE